MPKRHNTNFLHHTFKRLKMATTIPSGQPNNRRISSGTTSNTGVAPSHGGHEETQLDPISYGPRLFPGPPDYDHVILPFIFERQYRPDVYSNLNSMDFGIRMTSIYDPIRDAGAAVDINPGVGVTTVRPILTEGADTRSDTGVVAFYNYYASLYKYYSVTKCVYKIRVENLSHEKFYVHKMFVNNDIPTTIASNWDILLWRGVESRLVTPIMRFGNTTRVYHVESNDYGYEDDDMNGALTTNASGTVSGFARNPIGSPMAVFQGKYKPGQYQREVKLDDEVEIYTAIATNPTLPEVLLLRIKPYDTATAPLGGDTNNYERALTFNITVECQYHVEFKELRDEFYRPASRNPLIASYYSEAQDGV